MASLKAFFEEYGLVLLVAIIASAMILFSGEFTDKMKTSIIENWDEMVVPVN